MATLSSQNAIDQRLMLSQWFLHTLHGQMSRSTFTQLVIQPFRSCGCAVQTQKIRIANLSSQNAVTSVSC